jgi:hypothetical protein
MNSVFRVFLELLGPAFFGGLQALVVGIAGSKQPFGVIDIFQGAVAFFLLALIVCGIQSACYTILMELAYRRGLSRRSFKAIAFSTILGILSGASFSLYSDSPIHASSFLYFCSVGAGVGAVIASIIYYYEPKKEAIPA